MINIYFTFQVHPRIEEDTYSPLEENVASQLIVNTPKKIFQWISTTQMAIALFQRWH